MRRLGLPRRTVRHSVVSQDGSLLVEALVGVAILGMVASAVAGLLPAALDVEARASTHRTAVTLGDALLEVGRAHLDPEIVPAPALPPTAWLNTTLEHEHGSIAARVVPCGDPAPSTAQVTVQHGTRTDGRAVVLRSGPRIGDVERQRSGDLRLLPGNDDVPAEALALLDPDGGLRAPTRTGDTCLAYDALGPGTYWVTDAPGASSLVDGVHVPLAERPIPVSLDGRSHDLTVDAAPPGWLRVIVDDGGARSPDSSSSGTLRWFVRGDDANLGTDAGEVRPVRPGPVTAVIPPCHDAWSVGSAGTVTVAAGEEVTLEVALAVVTVQGIRGHSDARLVFQRPTACADGSPSMPRREFHASLVDGMRVALPRGEWEVWVQTLVGNITLSGTSRFDAVGSDVVVDLP